MHLPISSIYILDSSVNLSLTASWLRLTHSGCHGISYCIRSGDGTGNENSCDMAPPTRHPHWPAGTAALEFDFFQQFIYPVSSRFFQPSRSGTALHLGSLPVGGSILPAYHRHRCSDVGIFCQRVYFQYRNAIPL